jgi:hypothetical protein
MAQHFQLHEKDEPKLFKSVKRIVDYIFNNQYIQYMTPYSSKYVYTKNVMKLGNEYNPSGLAVNIRYYNLEDKKWDEREYGGIDLRKNVTVEVHINKKGQVSAIYYPI